jgi:hypothetical protein
MNVQLKANVENQDRAQCGQNQAGGMISFVCRARKHVGNAAADDRSDVEGTTPVEREKLFDCEYFWLWRLRGGSPFTVGAAGVPRGSSRNWRLFKRLMCWS